MIPKTGIECYTGLPGSGKSAAVCWRLSEIILRSRRLVYTNLPLEFRFFRWFLYSRARAEYGLSKESARAVSFLIKPLTQDHFLRFCDRLSKVDELARTILDTEVKSSEELEADAVFAEEYARKEAVDRISNTEGPEVLAGPKANWIPHDSVIAVDEIHKWFANSQLSSKKEPPQILAYTSMHRHMRHLVICITQRFGAMSLSFRQNCLYVHRVANLKTMAGLGRILPLIFKVSCFHSSDLSNGELQPGTKPQSRSFIVPGFNGNIVFRLYRSFSHVEPASATTAKVQSLQKKVGAGVIMYRTFAERFFLGIMGFIWKSIKWPFRHPFLFVFFMLILFLFGRAAEINMENTKIATAKEKTVAEKPNNPVPVLNGYNKNSAIINGVSYNYGEVVNGIELLEPLSDGIRCSASGNVFDWLLTGKVRTKKAAIVKDEVATDNTEQAKP